MLYTRRRAMARWWGAGYGSWVQNARFCALGSCADVGYTVRDQLWIDADVACLIKKHGLGTIGGATSPCPNWREAATEHQAIPEISQVEPSPRERQ